MESTPSTSNAKSPLRPNRKRKFQDYPRGAELEGKESLPQQQHSLGFLPSTNTQETNIPKRPRRQRNRMLMAKKRKLLYQANDPVVKRARKYYYISSCMTKPKRLKGAKPVQDTSELSMIDNTGNVVLKNNEYLKNDLFYIDDKKYNYQEFKKKDINFHIFDEIALEGLDGITLEGFWKRLRNVFPNTFNKNVAEQIWKVICSNKHISFYILSEPRKELVPIDRFKYMDVDSGYLVESIVEFKDIYPLETISNADVRGSCSTYKTRMLLNTVRRLPLQRAIKLYGQSLVMVADQALRNKSLLSEHADPSLEMIDIEYCILERIGRAREHGELTQGKISLSCFQTDYKNHHHNRKNLLEHSLIASQHFFLKSFSTQINISCSLVHLPRFYHKRRPKQVLILRQLSELLRTQPRHQIEFKEFRTLFGKHSTIIKATKTPEFHKFFTTETYPYRFMYPDALKTEYMHKSRLKERVVKVIKLIDPCVNVIAALDLMKESPASRDKEAESKCLRTMNQDFLRNVYSIILSSGKNGLTVQEIYDLMKVDFYTARMGVRKLIIKNLLGTKKIDLGRQQSLKFYAKYWNNSTSGETTPVDYKLNNSMLLKALKAYNNEFDDSNMILINDEPPAEVTDNSDNYPVLGFSQYTCSVFVTDVVGDDLKFYDIIVKGRDRLLLAQSNLLENPTNEFHDFLLPSSNSIKSTQLFKSEFGLALYTFLTSLKLGSEIKADNQIIFNMKNYPTEIKIQPRFHPKSYSLRLYNYNSPHSNHRYLDSIAVSYLLKKSLNGSCSINFEMFKNLKMVVSKLQPQEKNFDDEEDASNVYPTGKLELEMIDNVVMEKFMGPNPTLVKSETNEEGLKTELYLSTQPPQFVNEDQYLSKSPLITPRFVDRANLILKNIYKERIVSEFHKLFNIIKQQENEEGYNKIMCRKSLKNILKDLVEHGYIKIVKVIIRGQTVTKSLIFICAPTVSIDHTIIVSTIEQLKLKFYVSALATQKAVQIKKKAESPFSFTDIKDSVIELKRITGTVNAVEFQMNKDAGKAYGYTPKFVRMRIIHEHLYYLIHDSSEKTQLAPSEVYELCKSFQIEMSSDEVLNIPPIFCKEISWKTFIPPLPAHKHWPRGWTLACDVILRLPLSIFVKIYCVPYQIPELETYLEHPVKRHFLIKNLPPSIRNILLHRRKYFHHIYEMFSHLCYIGLLQFGPKNYKEKDQVFLYLNQNASLYDTCDSSPSYHQVEEKNYKKLLFKFQSISDVECYWSELWRICLNTPLGKRKVMSGQYVTIENFSQKPDLIKTLVSKTAKEAVECDDGDLPGDHKGAGGLDSSLWSYVKRNWIWTGQMKKKRTDVHFCINSLKREKFDTVLPQPIQYELLRKKGDLERKIYLNTGASKGGSSGNSKKVKQTKKVNVKKKVKKIIRKVAGPKKRPAREYYDLVDKIIMNKNRQSRVEWDEYEDSLLRLGRIASVFLCPVFKKQFIPYNVIRDVLHRFSARSENKSSRAVQRRIYFLLLTDETIRNMEANVGNLLNCEIITKYFGAVHKRFDNDQKYSDDQIYIAFIYLMSFMIQNAKEMELLLLGYNATIDFFSDSYVDFFEMILETVDDDLSSAIYLNPKSKEDIVKNTAKSVIHCSMCCKENNAGWAYQLFQIYSKLPDELIREAVAELKKSQLLTFNKGHEGRPVGNLQIPLKFSYLYNMVKVPTYTTGLYSAGFRKFLSLVKQMEESGKEGNFMILNELNMFWQDYNLTFEIPDMAIILNPDFDDHSDVIEELSNRFHLYLTKIHDGKEDSGSDLAFKNQDTNLAESESAIEGTEDLEGIKNEIMRMVFRVPYLVEGALEMYFKKLMESKCNLEINNYLYLIIVDLKRFAHECVKKKSVDEFKTFVDNIDEEQAADNQTELLTSLAKVVFAIQSLGLLDTMQDETLEDKFKKWQTEELNEENLTSESKKATAMDPKVLPRPDKNLGNEMDICIKRALEGQFPSLEDIKEGMMKEIVSSEDRVIPHITDLIMLLSNDRFPELDVDEETVELWKGHFVMQYPKLTKILITEPEEFKNNEIVRSLLGDNSLSTVGAGFRDTNIRRYHSKEDMIEQYINEVNGNSDDLQLVNSLIDFVKEKGPLGVPAQLLKEQFSSIKTNLGLLQLLKFLTGAGVLLRTGISSIIYVHYKHESTWLIETFSLTQKEKQVLSSTEKSETNKLMVTIEERLRHSEPVKVNLMPWMRLDGTLNEELFKEWLCLILSYCFDFPSLPFRTLCEQFCFIKPVDIFSLLEVLQDMKCIQICLYNRHDCHLLASRDLVETNDATCLDDFDDMYITPTETAGLHFGSYLCGERCTL